MTSPKARQCPSSAALRQLLESPHEPEGPVNAHIESCPACQHELATLCRDEELTRRHKALAKLRASDFRPRADVLSSFPAWRQSGLSTPLPADSSIVAPAERGGRMTGGRGASGP